MTLSEIENTLAELVSRHPNLDIELLRTLLLAAGWEDKNIQEAVTLLKQKGVESLKRDQAVSVDEVKPEKEVASAASLVSAPKEEITFYQPDGTEEGKLHAFVDTLVTNGEKREDTKPKEPKEEPVVIEEVKELATEQLPSHEVVLDLDKKEETGEVLPQEEQEDVAEEYPLEEKLEPSVEENILKAETIEKVAISKAEEVKVMEPQSLIVVEEPPKVIIPKKNTEIPEDLPLLPFESSPHVWSFSKYKDTFHGEVMPESRDQHTSTPVVQKEQVVIPQTPKATPSPVHIPVDVEGEKVPMNKSDESLVFLAGIMLLVIILILGYMYSNGRL